MNRRALLIANDSYHDPSLHSLYAPVKEAQTLRDLLLDHQVGNFRPADILVNESKAEIERAIERLFAQAGPRDLVCLYFSGHGVRDRLGRLHLAVGNTEPSYLASTSVSATFLKERMEETDAASVVVLLDCCYSGAFTEGFKGGPTVDVGRALQAGQGRYILTASSAVELAADGSAAAGRSRGSAFTDILVRGLSTGAADIQGRGFISPSDLWAYVRSEMPRHNASQTPTQYGQVSDETQFAAVKRSFASLTDTGVRVHLGDLLGRLTMTEDRGLRAEEWKGTGRYIVPIGQSMRDGEPAEPVRLDLSYAHGNLAVVGGPGKGTSTLLRTLVGGLSLTHTPNELRFVFLESGGNRLASMRRLPHVDTVLIDDDPEEIGRVLADLVDTIRLRKRLFLKYDIGSSSQFREARQGGDWGGAGQSHQDIFVVVDRWKEFADLGGEIPDLLRRLASNGLEYGVHLIVAARRWEDLPSDVVDLLRGRVELALSNPDTTREDAELARRLADDHPGWALHNRFRFRVALPELESARGAPRHATAAAASDGGADLVERVAEAWRSREDEAATRGRKKKRKVRADREEILRRAEEAGHERREAIAPSVQNGSGNSFAVPPARHQNLVLPTESMLAGMAAPKLDDVWGLGRRRGDLTAASLSRLRTRREPSLPIGEDMVGGVVTLPPIGGHSSHGLIVGTYGSGKSELIRSIITSVAMRHSSDELALAMISYEGEYLYEHLRRLPHAVATVERASERPESAGFFFYALQQEAELRRNRLEQGMYASREAYMDERRDRGLSGDGAFPVLLVVCDQFTGLLKASSEAFTLLGFLAREGQRLGIHLLLSTHQYDDDVMRIFAPYLEYRIALRTATAAESRLLLGSPSAYELPASPGAGYLRIGDDEPLRFRAATSFHARPRADGASVPMVELVTDLLSEIDGPGPARWSLGPSDD